MFWFWITLAILVGGVVLLVPYFIWLAHKAADVFAELQMVGGHAAEFAEFLTQVGSGGVSAADRGKN
jgi:hypothetical protein